VTVAYDYLFLTLARTPALNPRAPGPHQALARRLSERGRALAEARGEVVGQFAPQLGWANLDAAVLVRWQGAPGDAAAALADPMIAEVRSHQLTPTVRPGVGDHPLAGGIHVHRWFEIDAGAVDEFVALSVEGWRTFEVDFDARIFGLFRAEPDARDTAAGAVRVLLVTRYGDHGVWEASRDPTKAAMQSFMRRAQLTRRTWAASTLLIAR
jgi:hypothetical protein